MAKISVPSLCDEIFLQMPADFLNTVPQHDAVNLSSPLALFNLAASSPYPRPWLPSGDISSPIPPISSPTNGMSLSDDLTGMIQALFPEQLPVPVDASTQKTSLKVEHLQTKSNIATDGDNPVSAAPTAHAENCRNAQPAVTTDESTVVSTRLSSDLSTSGAQSNFMTSDDSDSSASASQTVKNDSSSSLQTTVCKSDRPQQPEQVKESSLADGNWKSIGLKETIDKADERRRKNRESSSKCYYKRKEIVDGLNAEIAHGKKRITELNNRALELRHENARLKRQVVTSGLRLPISKHNSFNHRPESTLHLRDYLLFLAFQGSAQSVLRSTWLFP